MNLDFSSNCPLPMEGERVRLAHGGGGRAMQSLLEKFFFPAFPAPTTGLRHDAAILEVAGSRLAFTTDSYVVHPYFFPGGDIGSLAVHGTINDLAVAGARPLYLSCGFILEEGLPLEDLRRIVDSMAHAADEAGVAVVTGDTKVVDRGKGDGIYLNTAGVGLVEPGVCWHPGQVRPGDAVLVSGDLGRHGMAIMACREGLELETRLESDSAPLWGLVEALIREGLTIRCLRDLTRGGLTSALVEIAEAAGVRITLDEGAVPVSEEVRGACELLGLDPLAVANEGRLVAFVAPEDAPRALEQMREHPAGQGSAWIGQVESGPGFGVAVRTCLGTLRPLDMLNGEQLPRIC